MIAKPQKAEQRAPGQAQHLFGGHATPQHRHLLDHFRAGVKCQKSAIEGACRDTHNDIRADSRVDELGKYSHLDSAQTTAAGKNKCGALA